MVSSKIFTSTCESSSILHQCFSSSLFDRPFMLKYRDTWTYSMIAGQFVRAKEIMFAHLF